MLNENADAVFEACKKDLHRCRAETMSSDLAASRKEARCMLAHMHEWLRDEYVSRTFLSALDTPYIQRQPLGVVLIFGSWNFPFVSVFEPLIGALAAASSMLLSTIVPKYLDK
ncbi:unnamed protein product, partial [Dicrocoelium dendriticum]